MKNWVIASLAVIAFAATTAGFAPTARAGETGAIVVAQALGENSAEKPKRSRKRDGAATKREPTINQMAARERQRKCSTEWKEAKAANKTNGLKWPQFRSKCNARLKGKTV
jgi:hypothetical protein